jgi:hypothetical protein
VAISRHSLLVFHPSIPRVVVFSEVQVVPRVYALVLVSVRSVFFDQDEEAEHLVVVEVGLAPLVGLSVESHRGCQSNHSY